MKTKSISILVPFVARRVILTVLVALATASISALTATAPSFAVSKPTALVALNPDDAGSIGLIDSVSGLEVASIPNVAYFPSAPSDGITNVAGLAFNPVDGKLYAMNYDCEVITINLVTGVSAPAAADFYNGNGTECEGFAINNDGVFYAGTHTNSDPAEIIYFDTDEWYSVDNTQTFATIKWLAFEPVSNTVYVGDDESGVMTVKAVSAVDGFSGLETIGIDAIYLSSVSFDGGGNAYAGYWGSGFYAGQASAFPVGLTSGAPTVTLTYWIAGSFGPADSGDVDRRELPATGMSGSVTGSVFLGALVVVAMGFVLTMRARRR